MIVPSRSTKTAADSALVMFAILSETGEKFIARHGRRSKLADHDAAGVIGYLGGFDGGCLARKRECKKSDRGIACARNIENLARFGRNVMRRLAVLKKHHAMRAEGDEDVLCIKLFEQRFPSPNQIDVF